MTSHFFRTCLETQNRPNYWYTRWFFGWSSLRQRNWRLNSGLKSATIVTDPLPILLTKRTEKHSQTFQRYFSICLLSSFVKICCRREVENILVNWRPWPPSLSTDQSEKHRLCRRLWVLTSCQILSSSFRLQRRIEKVSANQIETTTPIFCWRIGPKNSIVVQDIEYFIPVKFRQIPFCSWIWKQMQKRFV